MKLAPVSATMALLLLVIGVAISKPTTSDVKQLPLDFSGIDTLRIVDAGDSPTIRIDDANPARASWKDLKTTEVTVASEGNRMTIRTNLRGYSELIVIVPSRVRTFVVDSANMASKAPLDRVFVRGSGAIEWNGDIGLLRIEAVPPPRPCKRACGLGVQISDGSINRVEIRAPGGKVNFGKPDKIGAADLYLGPGGEVTLNDATRLGNIVLRDSESP